MTLLGKGCLGRIGPDDRGMQFRANLLETDRKLAFRRKPPSLSNHSALTKWEHFSRMEGQRVIPAQATVPGLLVPALWVFLQRQEPRKYGFLLSLEGHAGV